jgi:phosphoglycerate kinase
MDKKTIRDVDVSGKHVLMRVDFNVPLKEGVVGDDTRIEAALPTIQYLLEHNAAVILMSHLGRPKGKVVEDLRVDPVAARLSELLDSPVHKLDDCVGPEIEEAVREMEPGEVILLENTRFHAEEKANDPDFSAQMASLADVYVNDAFGACHRAHASTAGVAKAMRERGNPAVAGLLVEKELTLLGQAVDNPERPFVAILGGAKVSGKIKAIKNLLERCDRLLIGGGMANTFFKALGYELGESLVEDDVVPTAKDLMHNSSGKIVLPMDVVIADAFDNAAQTKVVAPNEVPQGWRILDIGPKTVFTFESALKGAQTVTWNGPLGVFEMPNFAVGTFEVARLLAELNATTIIGGGESAAAVKQAGLEKEMTHISTGGGASLQFLQGETLPALAVLDER